MLSIKEAIYRELKYGVCPGPLSGLLDPSHIKLDMRNSPSAQRSESDYPYLVFRRVNETENNQVNYAKDQYEFELIGLRSSAAKGDDLLEQMKDIVKDYFKNQTKTWGKFTAMGAADPTGGLRLTGKYVSCREGFSQELDEKAHLLTFLFTYLRS